jgi:hypothetical protein
MSEEEKKEKGFTFVDKRKTHDESGKDAQEEKERIPEEESKAEKVREQNTSGAAEKKTEGRHTLPEVDFNFFVLSLSSSAMMQMGVIPNPLTKKKEKNMEIAKQTIDIIAMLENKTKGNLTQEEDQFLSSILYDLRMKFVEENEEKA